MFKSLYTREFLEAVARWDGSYGPPSPEARKTPNGIQVLKNKFVENVFARAHPIVPGLWVLPLGAWMLYRGVAYQSPIMLAIQVIVGILTWTLVEYGIHIILFHLSYKPTDENAKIRQFLLHGYHHEFPNDAYRLVAPPFLAWPLAIPVAALTWAVVGTPNVWGALSGIFLGYLAYDWMHYYTHHFRPKSGMGKFLRDYHLIHHFAHPTKNMGLSSPLWDYVFGLAVPPPRTKK